MRTLMATLMTLGLTAGALMAEGPKPDVGNGRVAWFDITTSSLDKSKEFYGKLFDWQFTTMKGSDKVLEIVADGKPSGTLRVAEGAISGFNGMVYIQVSDVAASCAKAKELGGTVAAGFPFNLSDNKGAVGVAVDPVGHPVGMYSRTPVAEAPASPAPSPAR